MLLVGPRLGSVVAASFVLGLVDADDVFSEKINPRLIFADLRIPERFDLRGVLSRALHSPAVDLEPSVRQLQRRELHAHALEFGNECFRVKLSHGSVSMPRLEIGCKFMNDPQLLWNGESS